MPKPPHQRYVPYPENENLRLSLRLLAESDFALVAKNAGVAYGTAQKYRIDWTAELKPMAFRALEASFIDWAHS